MAGFIDDAGAGVRVGAAYSYMPAFARSTTTFESNLKFAGEHTALFGADTSTNTTRFLCYIAATGEIKTVIQAAEENSGNTTYIRSSGIFVPNDGVFHDVKVSYNFGTNTPYTVTIDGVASSGLSLAQNVYSVTWSRITAFILFAEKYREFAIDPNDTNNTTLFKSVKFKTGAWDLTQTVDNVAPSTIGGDALTLTDLETVYHAGFLTYLDYIKFPAITGVITGGVWRIKYEDIPAAALAQLNADGSDLRITTNILGGPALPIDIVSFSKVAGGIDIRLKADGVADSILHLWGNSPTAVQPLATDALGSQAVWSDEISSLIPMDGTSALPDRAGNVNDWRYSGSGSLSYSVNGTTLGAERMVSSSSLYQTIISDNTYSYRFIANVTAIHSDSTLIRMGTSEVRRNGTSDDFRIHFTNGARTAGAGFIQAFPTGLAVYDLVFNGSTHKLFRNGVQVWSYSYGVAMDWDATAFLFNHMDLILQGVSISDGVIPTDRVVAEASNLNAVGAWFIAEDVGGNGITGTVSYTLASLVSSIQGVLGDNIVVTGSSILDNVLLDSTASVGNSLTGTSDVNLDDVTLNSVALLGNTLTGTSDIFLDDVTADSVAILGNNISGTSAVSLVGASISSIAILGENISSIGSLGLGDIELDAQGSVGDAITSTGSLALADVVLDAQGLLGNSISGSATIDLADLLLDADALVGEVTLGVGALELVGVTIDSNALLGSSVSGSGSVDLDEATLQADTVVGNSLTGSATVSLEDLLLNASGLVGSVALGSGELDLQPATINSDATLGNILSGTGSINLDIAVINAIASVGADTTGTGNITLEDITTVGNGTVGLAISGAASYTLNSAFVTGIGTLGASITGAAIVTLGEVELEGLASTGAGIDGSANIVLSEATLAGIVEAFAVFLLKNDISLSTVIDSDLAFSVLMSLGDIQLSTKLRLGDIEAALSIYKDINLEGDL